MATAADIEEYERKLDDVIAKEFVGPTLEEAAQCRGFFRELLADESRLELSHIELRKLLAQHGLGKYRKNSYLIQSLYILGGRGEFAEAEVERIRELLKIKRGKSHSGILSITVFTSPYPHGQRFTCNWNCHYCPNEPGQPRSYLKGEPGVLRANRYGFDAARQMWGRLESLYHIGHTIRGAKLEVLVLGGTWTSYPVAYREEFVRDLYFAANTFFGGRDGARGSLEEEIGRNRDVTDGCRVIGLTLEMRPDSVTRQELYRLRDYGCTRVQLGVQHIDDGILKAINRQCTTARFAKTLRLLKNVGYKVDIHLMANLPFSTPEKDREMLIDRFLGMRAAPVVTKTDEVIVMEYDIAEPDLSADQWKLYPCETVPYTEIEKWYRDGSYVPYAKEDLYQLLYDTKKAMYPWIRCNRIIRDIPKGYIIASSDDPNTGQMILDDLRRNGDKCMCIRCREVRESGAEWDGTLVTVRKYCGSGGDEYFISAESAETLFGFLRLRVTAECEGAEVFPELEGCGLVRELHVYGRMTPVDRGGDSSSQHKGIGRRLLSVAEDLVAKAGLNGVAIIAGVGVQRYYEKLGYTLSTGRGSYMIRRLA